MSADSAAGAKILLKARPTEAQLSDRLAEPAPEGLELYLDVADISADDWLAVLQRRLGALQLPSDFVWVVEGPLRSLDGKFFDVTHHSPANVEVLRRLTTFGGAIGARGAVIHAIAPRQGGEGEVAELFSALKCSYALRQALPLLRLYVEMCEKNGLVPTVENVPPVTKMREERYMHSLIGMEPHDLLYLADAVDGLQVTLDVSHAQLYLNAALADSSRVPAELAPLVDYLAGRRQVSTLGQYIDRVGELIFEAHFSNARGIDGEGLAYDDGVIELDEAAVKLGKVAKYLVTETIEPDPDQGVLMRAAQRRMQAALARSLVQVKPEVEADDRRSV